MVGTNKGGIVVKAPEARVEPAGSEVKARAIAVDERKARPVVWWAALGAFAIVLQVWIFSWWIASGDAHHTPNGPTVIPHWMKVALNTHLFLGFVAFGAALYFFLIRPWRRSGHITLDGLLCIAFLLAYWQDPIGNINGVFYTINSYLPNWGSWIPHVPFNELPRGNLLPDPPLFDAPTYVYFCLGGAILLNWLMRKAKERWPQLGTIGVILVAGSAAAIMDFIVEFFWLRIGFYTYPGVKGYLTFFPGHYYQFPVYEIVIWMITWTAWASLRYFRNDRGQTIAERGIDDLRISSGKKTAVRLLALTGAVNLILFVCYMIPSMAIGSRPHDWPEDIAKRSYLTDMLCGPYTEYACPGPGIPNARPDSAFLGPNGSVVVPTGTKLPCQAPTSAGRIPSPGCPE